MGKKILDDSSELAVEETVARVLALAADRGIRASDASP